MPSTVDRAASASDGSPRTRPVRILVENTSPHVVLGEERSLLGTPAQRCGQGRRGPT
ncbi:hypothetical protein [Dictyobacter aurantiacus]|uniref:hypothetical protein n=1 Tax=Dictyobacter aurantiacus TaxID=1936993 RepID=UPI001359D2CD|nr:hypothetical protein [Dictyobacter aurantiacus]